jgi:superfamily II DNA helicase RecQ
MVFIKVITLVFDPIKERFLDELLSDFMKNIVVVSAQEHFFSVGSKQYLTLVLRYELSDVQIEQRKKPNIDYKIELSEADAGIFNLLKLWRARSAKSEGVPPYIIFSNKQLAQIANLKPQSLTDLSKIDGVGEAKIKKYGTAVLEITSHEKKER